MCYRLVLMHENLFRLWPIYRCFRIKCKVNSNRKQRSKVSYYVKAISEWEWTAYLHSLLFSTSVCLFIIWPPSKYFSVFRMSVILMRATFWFLPIRGCSIVLSKCNHVRIKLSQLKPNETKGVFKFACLFWSEKHHLCGTWKRSCHDSAYSSGILCHGTHNIPPPLHLPPSLVSCLTRLKKVPMMHGATTSTVSSATTPVTNVPFAESATSNQVCPFILASF